MTPRLGFKMLGTAAASLGVHALVAAALTGISQPEAIEQAPMARSGAGAVLSASFVVSRNVSAHVARKQLVESARQARREGTLELGEFLLQANAIDAAAESVAFDLPAARVAFAQRVRDLENHLATEDLRAAVALTFSDLSYAGLPGGRMGDTLLKRSGSCEPTSQIVAAALHDAKQGAKGAKVEAALRFYGGPTAGITHLAAVVDVRDGAETGEFDLMSGGISRPGGVRFAAAELIEVYATAHGLAADQAASKPSASSPNEFYPTSATRTLAAGYPPNADRFDAPLPLFGARAVAAPLEPSDDQSPVATEVPCETGIPLSWLEPPTAVAIGASGEPTQIDLIKVGGEAELERLAGFLVAAEQERTKRASPASRLMADACIIALYERAALQFALAGKPDIAQRANREALAVGKQATTIAQSLVPLSQAARGDLLASGYGKPWILLFVPGAEELTLALAQESSGSYAGVLLAAGLIVSPKTRARGLSLAEKASERRQVDIMHELFHAHASSRPWASNYELSSEEPSPFVSRYRVFRHVAWRLWEHPQRPSEVIAALDASARALAIDEPFRRAIAAYYVRNYHGLYRLRSAERQAFVELDQALAQATLPRLAETDDLSLTLSELESLGVLPKKPLP